MTEQYFNIRYEFDARKVLDTIGRLTAESRAAYICVADGNILSRVHEDLEYRKVVDGAEFSICDSSWVPLYLRRLYGIRRSQYCGSAIFADITEMRRYRMMFLGSSKDVLDALRERMTEVDPAIAGMSFVELPFCSADGFDYESIAAMVNADAPDIIWLSLGAPKQEQFASRLVPLLDRGVVIPVGAVFNFRSGLGINRAPDWMVRCHLEFVYRIFTEPRKQISRCRMILRTLPSIYREETSKKKRTI